MIDRIETERRKLLADSREYNSKLVDECLSALRDGRVTGPMRAAVRYVRRGHQEGGYAAVLARLDALLEADALARLLAEYEAAPDATRERLRLAPILGGRVTGYRPPAVEMAAIRGRVEERLDALETAPIYLPGPPFSLAGGVAP